MPQFSKRSRERLFTCHPDLIRLMNTVIQERDIIILCGHRGEIEQNKAYGAGNSKLRYPHSRHNTMPSQAVDIAPYPLDWNDIEGFKNLIGYVKKKAAELGIEIECGADWEKFPDYPHVQLKAHT